MTDVQSEIKAGNSLIDYWLTIVRLSVWLIVCSWDLIVFVQRYYRFLLNDKNLLIKIWKPKHFNQFEVNLKYQIIIDL